MKTLTTKQAAVLAFVKAFFKSHRYAPTNREVADHFKWKSATAARDHLKALVRKQKLTLDQRAHRNIVL